MCITYYTSTLHYSFFKCPGLCQYRPGHSQGENVNENEQKTYGFFKTYNIANFEAFC